MKIGDKQKLGITGIFIGIVAVVLVALGNPKNMGFCIACFIRDTAGALHLHTAPIVEYVRPEIIGIILGSFAISVIGKDFRPKGGSSPVLRFVIGFIVMIGALVFLGCPLRMVLRLGGGDLNALVGLLGFIAGIAIGCWHSYRMCIPRKRIHAWKSGETERCGRNCAAVCNHSSFCMFSRVSIAFPLF